ncbi:MAG TPA: thioredoxin domain-containing protein [Acidobacteriaceae bacterium]|nr:thioredoxin domain-containing protein [Acidobacteriaceae bacterium]
MKLETMIRKFAVLFAGISFALGAVMIPSQSHAQQQIKAQVLKPPPGSHVAIVEFDDLECPMCGRENPVLKAASQKYHIPWIRHDFPLRFHVWSFQGAVNARWFDTQGHDLGNEYRDAVFADQSNIETKDDLHQFTEKFAQQHGIGLPFVMDPQGKLEAEVKADYNLGMQLGVHQTPTAWVVTDGSGGAARYTEVANFDNLYSMLDRAIDQTSHGRK